MKNGTKQAILAVVVVALLSIVAFSVVYDGEEKDDGPDVNIVGHWYLVSSVAFDQDAKLYTAVNHSYDLNVTGVNNDHSTIFYGTTQGTAFTGAFVEKNIIYEYYTDVDEVRAVGSTSNGNLVMKEVHFYSTASGVSMWFVCINTYSKDPTPLTPDTSSVPDINLDWSSWDGYSLTSDNNVYAVNGDSFLIYEQRGSFFRAEMQQNTGSATVTKLLNGVFVNSYSTDSGTTYMAYLVSETGTLWNMYIRDDALILRAVKVSELVAISGTPVATERIYRNSAVVGPPGELSANTAIIGTWSSTSVLNMKADGTVINSGASSTLEYANNKGTLYTGTGTFASGGVSTGGIELSYSVVNKTIPSGYLYHTMSRYGTSYETYGYSWLSQDGKTMYSVSFWTSSSSFGCNGVTYDIYQKQ